MFIIKAEIPVSYYYNEQMFACCGKASSRFGEYEKNKKSSKMSGVIFKQGVMEVNPELLHYLQGNETFDSSGFLVYGHDFIGTRGTNCHGNAGILACFGIFFRVGNPFKHGFKLRKGFGRHYEFECVVTGPIMVFVKCSLELFHGFFQVSLLIYLK
jgi:hypothetical protein